MEENTKYVNPPLTEAVFELFFTANNWSPIVPGAFYGLVKEKYPIITQASGGFGISFGHEGVQFGTGNSDLTQFKSGDGSSIIQLSNNLLTVNKLPKYQGWKSYSEMIIEAVDTLFEVVDISKVNRLGLRTLNKVDIGTHSYENFKRYFNVYPVLPTASRQEINSIQLNYETPIETNKEVLAVSINTLRKEKGYSAPTFFQLYYTRIMDIDVMKILPWIENAHSELYKAFDLSLTSECKKTFNNA